MSVGFFVFYFGLEKPIDFISPSFWASTKTHDYRIRFFTGFTVLSGARWYPVRYFILHTWPLEIFESWGESLADANKSGPLPRTTARTRTVRGAVYSGRSRRLVRGSINALKLTVYLFRTATAAIIVIVVVTRTRGNGSKASCDVSRRSWAVFHVGRKTDRVVSKRGVFSPGTSAVYEASRFCFLQFDFFNGNGQKLKIDFFTIRFLTLNSRLCTCALKFYPKLLTPLFDRSN